MNNQTKTCPRCGSIRVQKQSYWRAVWMLLSGGCGGCLIVVIGIALLSVSTLLGAPLIGIGAAILLAIFVGYIIVLLKGKECRDCGHRWAERVR